MNTATDTPAGARAPGARHAAWIAAAVALALFYGLTAVENFGEPDDAYYFAWRVENHGLTHFNDPRLLLYHLAGQALWHGAQALGMPLSGLWALRLLSLAGAVLTLVFTWRVLAGRLGLPWAASFASCALLGVAYAFWRYSTEADVYLPALAATALVLWGLLAPRLQPWQALGWGAVAGLAVLMYQPSAIPLLAAFAVLVMRRAGGVAALLYLGAAGGFVAIGYAIAFALYWPQPASAGEVLRFLTQRAQEFNLQAVTPRLVLASIVQAVLAIGHDIAASQWAMGLEPVQRVLRVLLPHHDLDAEIHLATMAAPLTRAGAFTFGLLLLAAGWLAAVAWRARAAGRAARAALAGGPGRGLGAALALWLVLTLLVNGRLNASGAEAWSVLLLPLALAFALFVALPASVAGARQHGAALAALVLALGVHNAVGGIAIAAQPGGDLVRQRTAWLVEHARGADLVLVSETLMKADVLRYHGHLPATQVLLVPLHDKRRLLAHLLDGEPLSRPVRSISREFAGIDVVAAVQAAHARGGRVLLHDEWFEPVDWVERVQPGWNGALLALRERLPVLHRQADGLAVRQLPAAAGPAR